MGEKLAKKVDAAFTAHLEQEPLFQRAEDLTTQEAAVLLLSAVGALRKALYALALELPDP